MKTYNLSPTKKDYYRQNNNELDPNIVCKPTATIEALALAGWPLPPGKYPQPEDNLTALCLTGEAHTVMLKLDPDLQGTRPNEVWGVIAWAVNECWYPTYRPLIGPRWNWGLREVLYGITRGIPFATSTDLTKGGHVVNLVGYVTKQDEVPRVWADIDLDAITEIIIDDPYGDRTSGRYDTTKSGWNNRYPMNEWARVWRGTGVQVRKEAV